MIARDFQPLDLHRLVVSKPGLRGWRDEGAKLAAAGPCWSAVQDGQVLACAGLLLHWPGRAGAWCLIGDHFPRRGWVWLHKQVVAGLARTSAELGLRRIEAETLTGWQPGAMWLRKLGFAPEGPMPAYGPDGRDYDRWARITPHG